MSSNQLTTDRPKSSRAACSVRSAARAELGSSCFSRSLEAMAEQPQPMVTRATQKENVMRPRKASCGRLCWRVRRITVESKAAQP